MGLIYIVNNKNLLFYYSFYFILLSFLVRLGLAVNNNIRINCKTGGFFRLTKIFSSSTCHILVFLIRRRFVTERFCYRRRFVTGDVLLQETFCYGDVMLRRRYVTETLCYGDVMLRRRFVWRLFVEETFCDVLYVRHCRVARRQLWAFNWQGCGANESALHIQSRDSVLVTVAVRSAYKRNCG
jgi:hypothetical protein